MDTPRVRHLSDEDSLSLYAVLNVWEPPRRLSCAISDQEKGECKKRFHCHFQLPLPEQIIIFSLGKWEPHFKGLEIIAEVSIDAEIPPQKIGTLTCRNKVLCWDEGWTTKFLKRSEQLCEEGRMAKLTLRTVKEKSCHDKENKKGKEGTVLSPTQEPQKDALKSPVTPGNFKNLKQQKLSFVDCEGTEACPETAKDKITPPSKKRRRSNAETPIQKQNSQQGTGSVKKNPRNNSAKSPGLPTPPDTPSTINLDDVPSGRWGHDMCLIDKRKAVLIGGQGNKLQMAKDSVWTLNMSQGCTSWHQESCEGGGADRRIGHTVTYDPDKKVLYVYGGSKTKRWFSDVNILDLQTNTWSAVKAVGNAPTRAYHSCNLFNGELLVFGGVFPNPDPQPDGCSNKLYIFNTAANNWYKPITSGTPPSPKSGHSASLLGDRLVVFGGWDFPQCFNDVSIIDLAMMEFSCPTMIGTLPSPRSWHASTVLPRQRIFVHGGYDGNQILTDSFVFELGTLTWITVQTSDSLTPRAGHVALYLPAESEKEDKEEIAVFGGGDNAGGYFNDLFIFSPDNC
ncbi:hypothetical protein ACROYT_G040218 [Oculina patagonica]